MKQTQHDAWQQDTQNQSDTTKQKEAVLSAPFLFHASMMGGHIMREDNANCLMARDYKGIGNQETNAICVPVLTPDRAEKRQNGRRFKENGDDSFTLTRADRHGVMLDTDHCGVLRNVRTEYGKQIRKDYEAGNIDISRHEFLESEIREDGITNTLSTVQKDNQLAIPVREAVGGGTVCGMKVIRSTSHSQTARLEEEESEPG